MAEQTSPSPAVYKAIANVTLSLSRSGISKDRRNEQQGFAFRGIDDVYNALSPAITEAKLVILPYVVSREVTERQTRSGSNLFYVTVLVDYTFVSAEDGSMHVVRSVGEAMDSGDKATNKAMSAAYKYACFQTFCIPTEGDNDADATTHTVEPSAPKTAGKDEIETIKRLAEAAGVPVEKICDAAKVQSLDELPLKTVPAIVAKLQKAIPQQPIAA